MNISLSQLITGNMPITEFLETARIAGYNEVELSLRPAPEAPLNYQVTDAQLEEYRKQAIDSAVPITSLTIGAKSGNLLASGQAAADGIAEAIRGMECAAKLGAKVCLHTLGSLSPELYYEDAYQNAIAALKKLVSTADKLKLSFAVEFVWNGFLFSPLEMRNFLDSVGSPGLASILIPAIWLFFNTPNTGYGHWANASCMFT